MLQTKDAEGDFYLKIVGKVGAHNITFRSAKYTFMINRKTHIYDQPQNTHL